MRLSMDEFDFSTSEIRRRKESSRKTLNAREENGDAIDFFWLTCRSLGAKEKRRKKTQRRNSGATVLYIRIQMHRLMQVCSHYLTERVYEGDKCTAADVAQDFSCYSRRKWERREKKRRRRRRRRERKEKRRGKRGAVTFFISIVIFSHIFGKSER